MWKLLFWLGSGQRWRWSSDLASWTTCLRAITLRWLAAWQCVAIYANRQWMKKKIWLKSDWIECTMALFAAAERDAARGREKVERPAMRWPWRGRERERERYGGERTPARGSDAVSSLWWTQSRRRHNSRAADDEWNVCKRVDDAATCFPFVNQISASMTNAAAAGLRNFCKENICAPPAGCELTTNNRRPAACLFIHCNNWRQFDQ